ncbi:hypothetical protein BDZ94DRAFT_721113 [Collybia nuda]|uniref:Uncharacterized protein n=1 Tax=Collybia nuda TaxID=64659 RepID=A0A9P5Y7D0_9AGAR|nr:hypothetical protein BDZ94DRAFT_721113 [Collybia nuda]
MVAIKSIAFALATTVLAVNADWHLSFTYEDGGQVTSSGFLNSGCVDLSKTDSNIITIYFENNINSDTVELYANNGCDNKKYTAGPGSSDVPNARYLSYKVY